MHLGAWVHVCHCIVIIIIIKVPPCFHETKNCFVLVYTGLDSRSIHTIIAGSAAENSGLLVGDFIISVNGQNIRGLAHFDLVSIIKKVDIMPIN